MSHLRISPRHLGQMLMADFCPRCYFYQIQLRFNLPFDRPMPGIMYNMDIFEKLLVQAHIDEYGALPKWLKGLDCTDSVEFPAKMTLEFPEYDATLVGKPDGVFKNASGNLVLVDWKTARFKDEDPFLPAYATQLLGYVHLLEANDVGKVETAALVYFQNELKSYASDPLELLTREGFRVPFSVHIHEVEIDRSELKPLLEKAREFADMDYPPEGNDGCENCARLQQLLDDEVLRRSAEVDARQKDPLARFYSHQLEMHRKAARRAWTPEEDRLPERVPDYLDAVPGLMDF